MVEKKEPLLTADPRWRRVLDVDSGEVNFIVPLGDTDAGLPRAKRPKPRRHSSPYCTLYVEGALLIASSRQITGGDHRVLMALLATAPLEQQTFRPDLGALAALTGITVGNIGTSLTKLAAVGLLTRPRRGWIRFEPRYVWRGSVDSREEALAEKIASALGAGESTTHQQIEEEDEA